MLPRLRFGRALPGPRGRRQGQTALPWLDESLDRLTLWNPVLDLRRTFVQPELPWGMENYSPVQQKLLNSQGFLVIDGEFEFGRVLFEDREG